MIDPKFDGKDHLNVWSRAKTSVGQWMSNFYLSPFDHHRYGHFASMEAYWYWIATGRSHDELRPLYGFSAKSAGSRIETVPMEDLDFQEAIKEGITAKAQAYPEHLDQLANYAGWPFYHYFVYGDKIVDRTDRHKWQLEHWQSLAQHQSDLKRMRI